MKDIDYQAYGNKYNEIENVTNDKSFETWAATVTGTYTFYLKFNTSLTYINYPKA